MKFEPIVLQSRDGLTATLYLADNTQVLPVRCDAVVTDPPYGIGKTRSTQRPSDYQRHRGVKAREWDAQAADVRPLLSLASRLAIWGGNYYAGLPPSRGWLI